MNHVSLRDKFSAYKIYWCKIIVWLDALVRSSQMSTVAFCSSIVFLSILLVAPIWQVTYLPLADLADHAAQIRTIIDYDQYQADYQINWFTPYLVGYAITLFFSVFFSIPVAIKLTLSVSLLAVPAAGYCLIRVLGGNRFWVWVCFPIAYSYSFYWGFFSYIVATPITLLVIAYALWYSDKPFNTRRFIYAGLLSTLLFFAHAMAWMMAIMVIPLMLWIGNPIKLALKKLIPFLIVAPLIAAWMGGSGEERPRIEPGHYVEHYGGQVVNEARVILREFDKRSLESSHGYRIKELFTLAIGKPVALDYVLLSIFLMLWPMLIGAKLRFNPKLWLPPLAVAGAFVVFPYWIFGTAYVYLRFAVFLIPVFLLVYRPKHPHQPKTADEPLSERIKRATYYAVGFLVVVAFLNNVKQDFVSFKPNDEQFAAILSEMEPGKQVLTLTFQGDSPFRFTPAYLHFGSWYQAEKGGVAMMSFPHDPGAKNVPVRYRHKVWPAPSVWNANEFNWSKHQGWRYDYFLIRADSDKSSIFKRADKDIELLANHGVWYLYGPKKDETTSHAETPQSLDH